MPIFIILLIGVGLAVPTDQAIKTKEIQPLISETEIFEEFDETICGLKVVVCPEEQKKQRVKSLMEAIKQVESGGNYKAYGKSGEYGAYQFTSSTWNNFSEKYFGSEIIMTKENQDLLAEAYIGDLVASGYSDEEIALIWNGGSPVVKSGVNKHGVSYDTGAYRDKILKNLKK